MKKIYVIIALMVAVSCHGDLEPELYDTINPTIFYKSEADATAGVTGIYNRFKANTWGNGTFFSSSHVGFYFWPEVSTDIMTCQWGWMTANLVPGNWSSTLLIRDAWGYLADYNDISKATLLAHRIEPIDFNAELKNRYLAELKAAKGIIGLLINSLWGPVPVAPLEILLNPVEENILPRLSEEDMNEFIRSNLSEAADVLPASYSDADWGRFNKGTALTFLMKHYLNTHQWANAETAGREILTLGYALQPDYPSVFANDNQRNSEIIYATPGNETWGNLYFTSTVPWIATTENPNISKWGGIRMEWGFYDTFEANDLRRNVIWDEFTGSDGITYNRENPGNHLNTGVAPMKYGEDPTQSGRTSSTDFVILRYSDVLLMLAEAITFNNGIVTQEAVDLINQVRNRAGLSDRNLSDYPDLDTFVTEILLERGHELFCEGWRRMDLNRHGKFVEYVKAARPNSQIQPHMTLFALSQDFIDEGKGIIIQNPGY